MSLTVLSIKGICKTYGKSYRQISIAAEEVGIKPFCTSKEGSPLFHADSVPKIINAISKK